MQQNSPNIYGIFKLNQKGDRKEKKRKRKTYSTEASRLTMVHNHLHHIYSTVVECSIAWQIFQSFWDCFKNDEKCCVETTQIINDVYMEKPKRVIRLTPRLDQTKIFWHLGVNPHMGKLPPPGDEYSPSRQKIIWAFSLSCWRIFTSLSDFVQMAEEFQVQNQIYKAQCAQHPRLERKSPVKVPSGNIHMLVLHVDIE